MTTISIFSYVVSMRDKYLRMKNNKYKSLTEAYRNVYVKEGLGDVLQNVGDAAKRIGAISPDEGFYSRERQRNYEDSVKRQAEYAQQDQGSEKVNLNLDIIREKLDQLDGEFQGFASWSAIKMEFNKILNKYRK
jgi:hypothetical protein